MNVFDCGEKKTAHKMAEALLRLTENTSLRGVQREDQEPVGTSVYSEADRDIMEEAIKERFLKRTTRSQSSLGQPKERISTFFEPA